MTSRLILAFVVVTGLASARPARAQALVWSRMVGSAGYDRTLAVAVDAGRNVYQVGTVQGPLEGRGAIAGEQMCLIKWHAAGKKLWTRVYGSVANFVYPAAMAVDDSNAIYVAGLFDGGLLGHEKVTGQHDLFLLKLDANGSRLWMRTASSRGNDFVSGLAIGASGNIYVAGYTDGPIDGQPSLGSTDIVLLKYTPAGERLWLRVHGTAKTDLANAMVLDAHENIYIAGSTIGPVSLPKYELEDIYVAKYDQDGAKQWERLFGGARMDEADRLALDSKGNVYVGGWSGTDLNAPLERVERHGFNLIKLDPMGAKLWIRAIDGPNPGRLAFDKADHLYQVGRLGEDFFLAQYDTEGGRRWSRSWGTPEPEWLEAIAIDADGVVYAGGDSGGRPAGQKNVGHDDLYLVKYNPRPPSFDCGKATSLQEQLICRSERLSALDSQLDELCRSNLPGTGDDTAFKAEQVSWLKTTRNACTTADQLEAAMKERMAALQARQNAP